MNEWIEWMNQSKQSLYCTAIIRALDLHSGGLKIKQVFFFIYENFLIFFFWNKCYGKLRDKEEQQKMFYVVNWTT